VSDEVSNRLIAELEAEAKLVDHGEFTMDDVAARTKLARYRLADPSGWACLVVEAANLFGATRVEVFASIGQIRFVFDGEPVDGNAIFSSAAAVDGADETGSRLGLRKLAIAISTLFDQFAVAVDIESPLGRVRVPLQGPNQGSPSNERNNVFRVLGVPQNEAVHLHERCRHSPMRIEVEYQRISYGLRSWLVERRARNITAIVDGERTIGYVGWLPGESPASIQFMTHGVATELVTTTSWEGMAIVDVPLRKDVGERAVLRDAEFERVMALVEAAAPGGVDGEAASRSIERVEAKVPAESVPVTPQLPGLSDAAANLLIVVILSFFLLLFCVLVFF
jgi:hypothetical protein